MAEDKPFCISKWAVLNAWTRVRANQGAAGIDDVSVTQFEKKLKNNLYRIWNRMSSGSYVPPPVKRVMIPKPDGRERPLGIPTVGDRVAQMVVKMYLEPIHAASEKELDDFSRMFNRYIRGWVNYYGRFYPSALHRTFDCINRRLVRWAMKKYKRYRGHQRRATQWLRCIARKRPELFAHWQLGIVP